MVGVRRMALAGRVLAHVGRRTAERRGQVNPPYFLLAVAVVVLVGIAVFAFGGAVSKTVVTGRNANTAPTAAAATPTGRPGGGVRA